jgi:hypothetical protein
MESRILNMVQDMSTLQTYEPGEKVFIGSTSLHPPSTDPLQTSASTYRPPHPKTLPAAYRSSGNGILSSQTQPVYLKGQEAGDSRLPCRVQTRIQAFLLAACSTVLHPRPVKAFHPV